MYGISVFECTQYLHNFGASLQTSKLGMTHITSSKTVVYLASKIRLVVFLLLLSSFFRLEKEIILYGEVKNIWLYCINKLSTNKIMFFSKSYSKGSS